MTFLVHPVDTSYFRLKISNIRAEFQHVPGEKVYAAGSFDNYYEFETSVAPSAQFPNWSDFERSFVYETEMDYLLVAKRFVLGFYSQVNEGTDTFIGQAVVDLLTIAAGPPTITLRIMSGDTVVGRAFFDLAMQEFSEMKMTPESVQLVNFREDFNEFDSLQVVVRKGFTTEERIATLAARPAERVVELTFEPHYFGASPVSLMESTGIRFELTQPGCCGRDLIGSGNLLLVSNPLQHTEGNTRNARMKFSIPIIDRDNAELCKCEGTFMIENLPVFCQMSSGLTVDGVVVEGQQYPIATVKPPFLAENFRASHTTSVV